MDQTKDLQQQQHRKLFQFAATVFTNPPFAQGEEQDKSKKAEDANSLPDEYYFQAYHDFKERASYRNWLRMENTKGLIQPYYSAYIRVQQKNSKYSQLLVTGGVIYSGSQNIDDPELAIPRSTNFGFKITLQEDLKGLRSRVETTKLLSREVTEVVDGKKVIKDIDEEIDLIPPMTIERHNHSLFKVTGPKGENRYYAIGGQMFSYSSNDGKIDYAYHIHNSGEYLDESNPTQWVAIAPMKIARTSFSGFVSQGKIYVFGGYSSKGVLSSSESEIYDIASNSWSDMKLKFSMKMSAQLLGVLCLPLKKDPTIVLLIGGSNSNGPTDQITLFDTKTSKLTLVPVRLAEPRAKMNHIFIKQDDKVYLVILGGSATSISLEAFEYIENGLQTQLVPVVSTTERVQDPEDKSKEPRNHNGILRQIFVNKLTQGFNFAGYNGEIAWIQALRAMPVILFSDYEVLEG